MFNKTRKYYYKWDILYVQCYMCKWFKTIENFSKDNSKRFWIGSRCKACEKKYNYTDRRKQTKALYYKNNKQKYVNKNRERRHKMKETRWFNIKKFHEKAQKYILKNNLRPEECSICKNKWIIEFHHPSYENKNKRKEWIFVCKSCHRNIHLWIIECPVPIDLTTLLNKNIGCTS